MRALLLTKHVAPSEIHVTDIEAPEAGDGQVLVRVYAAGVNPSDVKYAGGVVPTSKLPRIPGRDFAGVVEQGPEEMVGQAVYGTGGDLGISRDGTHAYYIVLPASAAALKPASLSMSQAASVGVPYVTAFQAVVKLAALQRNETMLVLGGSGAVGTAAAQIAKWLGARVIATTRAIDRPGVWRDSADIAITVPDQDVVHAVMAATDGSGARVVFNAAGGGAIFEDGVNSLAHGGRMVCISASGERRVSFDLMSFYKKELRWYGLDTLELSASDCAPVLDQLRPAFDSGQFAVEVARELPLDRAAEAYELVSRGGVGKVVLTML